MRNRFHEERNLISSRRVKLAFHAGYTALDALDSAAAGSASHTARLLSYLDAAPPPLTQPPAKAPQPKRRPSPAARDGDPPPAHKFLAVFPRAAVRGARKAPFMVNANGFPFVRWKKPQPAGVSRVLRQKIENRGRRLHRLWHLEDYWVPLARLEDRWEGLVRGLRGGDEDAEDAARFVVPMETELAAVKRLIYENAVRTTELMHRMQAIVDRERELAMEERLQREQLLLKDGNIEDAIPTQAKTGLPKEA